MSVTVTGGSAGERPQHEHYVCTMFGSSCAKLPLDLCTCMYVVVCTCLLAIKISVTRTGMGGLRERSLVCNHSSEVLVRCPERQGSGMLWK